MVYLEHLNIFPEATRLFIIKLADQGHPVAAAIIGLPLDPHQAPPILNEREAEYLNAAVTLLRAEGTLFHGASELTNPVPRADQYLGIPAPILPTARPQPSQAIVNTAAAPPRALARPQQQRTTFFDAPTRGVAPSNGYRHPSAGAGPSRHRPPAPVVTTASAAPPQNQVVEEDEGNLEDETDDGAHTYSIYAAKNIVELYANTCEIHSHPDPLVETASLASVQLPDLEREETKKDFEVLQDDVEKGRLSDAQIESIIYASTKFEKFLDEDNNVRCGFFLGDGAGVGKGRTIAGLIKHHWLHNSGRRILWVSVSQDLRRDARRDLDDLGLGNKNNAGIAIHSPKGTNHIPGDGWQGVVFITYSLLRSGLPAAKKGKRKKKKSAAGGASGSRVAQVMAMEAANGNLSAGSTSDSDVGGDDDDEDQEESFPFEME